MPQFICSALKVSVYKVISTEKDFEKGLTTHKVVGTLSYDELLNCIIEYYSGTVTGLILWDFTDGDISGITTNEFRNIAVEVKSRSSARIGGKTAFVFSKDLSFGLGRMTATFGEIEGLQFEVESFRSIAEAKEWLGV